MKQKITFFKVLLTLVLLCGVGNAWGVSYTLTFKTGSNDGTTITTSTVMSDILSAGSDYVSSISSSDLQAVYCKGTNGLKLGKSSGGGILGLVLSPQGRVWATSIVVKAKLYNSGKAATIKVNDCNEQNVTADFANYTFDINSDITSIILKSSKYCWVSSVTVNYSTNPVPSISANNVQLTADATSGEIEYTLTNPVTGEETAATLESGCDWISNVAVDAINSKVSFTTNANTGAARSAKITISHDEASKEVTVTQAKPTTFATLAALVATGEPTETGETVTVTLTDEQITGLDISGNYTNGIFLISGTRQIEIYCRDVPTEWIAGGTVSGTLENCTWKKYGTTWELCPEDWTELTYTAPTTYKIIIDELTNGTITASTEEAVAGAEITLTITPNAHYALKDNSLCVLNETTIDEIEVVDNKFTMPESNVLVSAEFVELPKHTVLYSVLGEDAGDEEVYAGETIANAPTPDGFDGWEFAGWTTDEDYAMSTTAPDLFTATTPVDKDVILYAVFKKTEGNGDSQYVKVTTAPADWIGKYLIVFEGAEVNGGSVAPNAFNGSLESLDAVSNYVSVSIVDDAIAVDKTNENAYFEISKIDGDYCITSHSGYSIGGTSNSNALNSSKTDQYINTIELAAEGNVIITSNSTTLQFNGAKDQLRYRYYKTAGGQKPVYLYKLEGGATTYYTTNKPKTQNVKISEAGYATAFIPFNATVEGATAYYVTVSGNQAQLNEIKGTIPANTGVVLKGSAGTVTFTESAVEPESITDNLLIGTTEEGGKDFEDNGYTYYILSDGENGVGFYWDGENYDELEGMGAHCAQYKAVLAVSNTSAGAPSFFTFDDATAINTIGNVKTSSVRYNLNGQAVGEDYKGIVIVNGKKMFNK